MDVARLWCQKGRMAGNSFFLHGRPFSHDVVTPCHLHFVSFSSDLESAGKTLYDVMTAIFSNERTMDQPRPPWWSSLTMRIARAHCLKRNFFLESFTRCRPHQVPVTLTSAWQRRKSRGGASRWQQSTTCSRGADSLRACWIRQPSLRAHYDPHLLQDLVAMISQNLDPSWTIDTTQSGIRLLATIIKVSSLLVGACNLLVRT